jgi:hypothetical protein
LRFAGKWPCRIIHFIPNIAEEIKKESLKARVMYKTAGSELNVQTLVE